MNFLELYMDYAKNSEVMPSFHFWTGLTILGASLQRNVLYGRGYYTLYPNLWTLIVAGSGTKKTTAVQIGYNLLSKLEHVRLLPDKGSPEGLAEALSEAGPDGEKNAQGMLYAPELANFMDRRQHNDGLVQFLLRISDCPDSWKYRTRGGGIVTLNNTAVTFLGASANDLLYECIPPLALKSGFLARFICVTEEGEAPIFPFPWKDPSLESQVLSQLYELSLLKGEMIMGSKAQEWFISWYFRYKADMTKYSSSKLRAYWQRKPDHLLRVAMLLSIAETARLEYTIDSFEKAIKALDGLEPELGKLYNEIDATTVGRDQLKLLEEIKRAGGSITHETLLHRIHATMSDSLNFKKCMIVLIESGKVVLRKEEGTVVYKLKKGG